jgi:hypothetical protein
MSITGMILLYMFLVFLKMHFYGQQDKKGGAREGWDVKKGI